MAATGDGHYKRVGIRNPSCPYMLEMDKGRTLQEVC